MPKQMTLRPNEVLEHEARINFSDHVQSIAFNLTLSRRMIGMLQIVRDHQWRAGDEIADDAYSIMCNEKTKNIITNGGQSNYNWYSLEHSLVRRGLIYRPYNPKTELREPGMPLAQLTQAGKLVCELLVEAGLMPSKLPSPEVPKTGLKRRRKHV